MKPCQVAHLQRAHRLLVRPDHESRPCHRRRNVQIGVGTFVAPLGVAIFGISFALLCPGGTFPDEQMAAFWLGVIAVPVVVFISGTAVAIYGWLNREQTPLATGPQYSDRPRPGSRPPSFSLSTPDRSPPAKLADARV